MGRVSGVKEKLHWPLYDAFFVDPSKTFAASLTDPRMIRFFVDVQNKTSLETNLQASGTLPSQNSYEARALRVLISLPPLPTAPENDDDNPLRNWFPTGPGEVTDIPPGFGADDLVTQLIYNSVTTLLVGEKDMIKAPTFFFPGGAGVSPGGTGPEPTGTSNNGHPDPMATFRFSEPVTIEPQQNFRVEMLFPQGIPGQNDRTKASLATVKGPLRIWVVLDGYLTRDVQ